MKPKFELGQSVHCDFIGTITKIEMREGKIKYLITKDPKNIFGGYAMDMDENHLTKLEEPEDYK